MPVRAVPHGSALRSPLRILVVEDDALLADGLTAALTHAGHAILRARTGKQADAVLASDEFDLVILDIGLPDIDGFEVLRRLRSRRVATNVLVLTARDAVEDRVHGLDLGADDYLTKPFSRDRVRGAGARAAAASCEAARVWSIGALPWMPQRSACESTTSRST